MDKESTTARTRTLDSRSLGRPGPTNYQWHPRIQLLLRLLPRAFSATLLFPPGLEVYPKLVGSVLFATRHLHDLLQERVPLISARGRRNIVVKLCREPATMSTGVRSGVNIVRTSKHNVRLLGKTEP